MNLHQQVEHKSPFNRSSHATANVRGNNAKPETTETGSRSRRRLHNNFTNPEEYSEQMAMNLIQGKWKIRILSRLQHGPVRLGELRRTFPQASKKMLVQNLREMERDGLVIRKDLSIRMLHVEYSLSDSTGIAVLQLINMLRNWSKQYLNAEIGGGE